MMPTVEFQPNVPVDLALKFSDGKPVNSRGPVARFLFTTTDERALFLDESIAKRIQALSLQPGEPFRMCKAVIGRNTEWKVERIGEQKDGTFMIPKLGGAAPSPEFAAPVSQASSSNTLHPNMPAEVLQRALGGLPRMDARTAIISANLREDANMLIDVMGSCIEYAKKYNGAVSNDDVRALAITIYIQHTKGPRA
jgi:hypothetical protein